MDRAAYGQRVRRATWVLLTAAALGILTVLAYAPWNQPLWAFAGPAGLILLLHGSTRARDSVLLCVAYGVPYFWFSLSYLNILGPIAVGALALHQSLFVAGCLAVYRWSRDSAPAWLAPLLAASAWTLADLMRANMGYVSLTLSNLGVALSEYPELIQSADLGGLHLITFLVAWTSAALAEALTRGWRTPRRWTVIGWTLGPVAVAWVLNLGYGAACLADDEPGATMRVAICQPAERIPGYYGRVAMTGVTHEVGVYRGLLEEAGIDGADLILWPESGVSEDLVASSFARGVVGDLAASMGAHIITGCHRQEGDRYYNSVVLVSPEGDVLGQYHKRHVVAFGEFLYFREQLKWLYERYPIRPYDLTPGAAPAVFDVGGRELAPIICYESTFGGEVRRALRAGGELLAVHTNDGWFDSEMEAYQHARTSIFRAIEFRVDVVRAASTAYSGHIDRHGRWRAVLARDEDRAIIVEPTLRPACSVYLVLGDGPLWVICPGLLAGWLLLRRKINRSR
jgi:apolipoprotein N-acyltransferase